jgi:hypothetical protein
VTAELGLDAGAAHTTLDHAQCVGAGHAALGELAGCGAEEGRALVLYREMTLSLVFSSCIKHHHGCSNILGDSRAKWISITMAN